MGVTSKRIAFSALALAAILLPLRKPAQRSAAASGADRSLRLDSLNAQWRSAQLSWSAFALRDSGARLIASRETTPARPTVALAGYARGTSTTEADSFIGDLWHHIGTVNPLVRMHAVLYSYRAYHYPSYSGAMITDHGDTTDCVAIAPAGTGGTGDDAIPLLRHQVLRSALAPCALLAAFGRPGAGVAGWLSGTRYAAALSDDWLVKDPLEQPDGPWVDWFNTGDGQQQSNAILGWMNVFGLIDIASQLHPQYAYGAAGLRCINGDLLLCVNSVLHSAITPPAASTIPTELTVTSLRSRPDSTNVGTVRPPTAGMISDLIVEHGRERFQRFWTSDRPFETAFQDAFGESLGTWTARWSRQQWLGTFRAKQLGADILLGVTLKPSWLPPIVGWSVLALAIAAMVAKRRTA
jgi:hypothetical protein